MEAEIVNYLKRYGYFYIKLDDNDIKDVYDGFFNGVFKDDVSGMVKNYYGIYYKSIGDHDSMIKNYLEAADLGNKNSMNNMGFYYHSTGDFENMKKYYLMAVELGDPFAMSNLGYYYYTIGDYDNMIKYYLMEVEQDSTKSIEEMLINNKNYQEFKINFILALFQHHKNIFDKQEYVEAILFHIEQHFDKKDINDKLLEIITYVDIKHFANCSKLLLLTKKLLNEKINLIDLHFRYAPTSKGCQEAKADFLERLT